MTAAPFRFTDDGHVYTDAATGARIPNITSMLDATGWVDSQWFTEESSIRGTAVHALTADYDLGALDVETCVSEYKGWLLAYVKVMGILQAQVRAVEEMIRHAQLGFVGRLDRIVAVHGVLGIVEIKSGLFQKSHPIQTALQAVLAAQQTHLPPERIQRFCLYIKENGRFKVEEHVSLGDFVEAQKIIRKCCP